MTAALSLSRQLSEIDDLSDGGFQFSHPLFAAGTTPARTDSILSSDLISHTSPIAGNFLEQQQALKTPAAQSTYTRFGRRLPFGPQSHSSDGQVADTPAQANGLGNTSKASASVARWKRPGRIGKLGPPKRAERQSLEPEDQLCSPRAEGEGDKENDPPSNVENSTPCLSISSQESKRGELKQRTSISPSCLNRSANRGRSDHIFASVPSEITHLNDGRSMSDEKGHSSELVLLHSKEVLDVCRPGVVSDKPTSDINVLRRRRSLDAGRNSSSTQEKGGLHIKTQVTAETTNAPAHTLNRLPEPCIATHDQVPTISQVPLVRHPAASTTEVRESCRQYDQGPPPKMSLDVTASTAVKKAKPLGRIIMNGREYTKLGQIGKGGSSKVFRVMATNGRIYALKRVDFEQADQATISGYKSEIDLLNKMSASSGRERIIALHDSEINDERGKLLMLMEAGEIDLAHILTKKQAEPPDFNFIRLFWRHMLEAVQAVHEQKIVHSDLKPANFLLVEGSLKLIDFGIAKAIGNDTTNIHRDQQVGTVNYMSPEALSDTGNSNGRVTKLGRASDVWSLGCILYQMVYGRTPFAHLPSVFQKMQAIPSASHRIDFPAKAYPALSANDTVHDEKTARVVDGDLLRVMRGCLERDHKQRLTIEQLLSDPFLRPEDKVNRPLQTDSVAVNLKQITELLRLAVYQTREKTIKKETIQSGDIDSLAKDFFDRLRWAA